MSLPRSALSVLGVLGIPRQRLGRLLARFPPYGLARYGKGSKILWPRHIRGGNFISIGDKTFVHRGLSLQAIDRVGSQQFTPSIRIGSGVYVGQDAFIACI